MAEGNQIKCIVLGGSAGSLTVLFDIIKGLTLKTIPVIVVIHRQRNGDSELVKILRGSTGKGITEPEDKEAVKGTCIYIAPQNYHLLIEKDFTFSLDYSEVVRYSRPSIDVTFESAAKVYKNKMIGIILSGANSDGTLGLKAIADAGGITIAQAIETAQYPVMPKSVIDNVKGVKVLTPIQILEFLNSLE